MHLTFQSKIKSGASSSCSTSSEVSSSEVSYNFSRKAGVTLSSSDKSWRPRSGNAGVTTAMSTYDESRLRVAKPRRNIVTVSLSCSELCAIIFAVGLVVGNPLKTGVWKWVSKLLRRSKDD